MGAEKKTQWFIAHTTFAENLGSVFSTNVHLISKSSIISYPKDPTPLPESSEIYTHVHVDSPIIHNYKIMRNKSEKLCL